MLQLNFYKTPAGRELILDWLRALSREERLVVGEDLRAVQIGFPMGLPLCRPLRDGLYEVRSTLPNNREARCIFFHHAADAALVVVEAFIKKTPKTPVAVIDRALKRKREFGP